MDHNMKRKFHDNSHGTNYSHLHASLMHIHICLLHPYMHDRFNLDITHLRVQYISPGMMDVRYLYILLYCS